METVLKRVPFQTPAELVELLRDKLAARVADKGERLCVEELHGVREFGLWLAPLGITLHNAFVTREHIVAPHAFTFKLKRSLAPRELRQVKQLGGRDTGASDNDVMCVYKTWMHSTDSRGPLLVLPACRRDLVAYPTPQEITLRPALQPADVNELTSMATLLEKPQYNLGRGAAALRQLISEPVQYTLPPSDWLATGVAGPPEMTADTGNQIFTHLPDTSWNLLATFHRR